MVSLDIFKEKQQELIDDFAFLSDWEQKYEYIIDLGKELKGLPEEKKKEDISEKNNISLDEDEEKKLREIERKEIQELKEKLNLKRDFCTIEEYIYLYKEYEKQNKKLKSYLKDIRSSRTYNRKLR